MSYGEEIGFTAVVAALLSVVHVVSPLVRGWSKERAALIGPISAGALAAYVFLHLLPSIDDSETEYGMTASLVVLAGFVIYYGLETWIDGHHQKRLRVSVAIGWGYSFLIVYSLPGTIEESPIAALVSAVALAVHVLQSDNRMAWEHPEPFDRWGRYVLATAPLAAVAVDLGLGKPDPQAAALLSAFASGVLILSLFRDEIGRHQEARAFPWFLLGLALYGGLLLLESAFV